MGFVDEANIVVKSGKGGDGCVSFRREKFIPKGGPDGGDGGKGGDVLIKATGKMYSLYDFGSKRYFKAENGKPGSGRNRAGRKGKDIRIFLPVGTLIKDAGTEIILADLTHNNQEILLLEGGTGGKGNKHFASSTNRTPRFAQKGEEGKEKEIKLELKLIADIGIIGLPNVGKSTLLSRLSNAHPEVADYEFTTLAPNLGVIVFEEGLSLTIADIPGLIEEASSGKGLGNRFLKHIERTKVLLHVIDINRHNSKGIHSDFLTVRKELQQSSDSLGKRRQIVLLNKIDVKPLKKECLDTLIHGFIKKGYECMAISALTGDGIENLKELLKSIALSL
ncbi:MAG: GTPase ObgE [Deltaproteobacteria bacterium]|nr:GTPase ObgE [Deltaproteobacteria bacterium]